MNSNNSSPWWVVFFALSALVGCQPADQPATETLQPDLPRVSNIPLRITIVGELAAPEVLKRRWLAESEQPIELQLQTAEQFLTNDACPADVLIFPSHLLGELVQRDWVLKLPELPPAAGEMQVDQAEESAAARSSAAASACRYGGEIYCLPLGCSIAQWVASDPLGSQLSAVANAAANADPQQSGTEEEKAIDIESLEQLLERDATSPPAVAADFPRAQVDRDAVVDRFLTLLLHLSPRQPQYGLLLDIETLEPELTSPPAMQAVALLQRMSQQPGGLVGVLGSHDSAFQWAATHQEPVLALASVSLLGADSLQLTTGQLVAWEDGRHINIGRGLIVGLAAESRQTLQSLSFINWLSRPATTQSLAPFMPGVDLHQPLEVESTAWRMQQSLVQALTDDRLPQEPRLPHAHRLRSSLGDALITILFQEQTPAEAMIRVQAEWQQAISGEKNAWQQSYKTSLGLRESQ